jgi:uncharacterized membrane protein
MRSFGSLLVAILVAAVAVYLLVKLVFFALKLVVLLIGLGIVVAIFFAAERAIRSIGGKA